MLEDAEREELAAQLDAAVGSARARLATLERERTSIVEAADTANIDDEHDPEGSTIAYERQLVIAMIEAAEAELAELERAVEMVRSPEYGRCVECGRPIGIDRLRARPATTRCVDCSAGAAR